jgi:hypothetical protein
MSKNRLRFSYAHFECKSECRSGILIVFTRVLRLKEKCILSRIELESLKEISLKADGNNIKQEVIYKP